jgi:nucleotide-binding universal stress UspA family protein
MKLLVCIDFSVSTEKFIQTVAELAKTLSAKLWLLHVAEAEPDFLGFKMGPKYIRDVHSEIFRSEHRQIQRIADRLRKANLDTTAILVQGATVESILDQAAKLDDDRSGLSWAKRNASTETGSVSESVLRKSVCPVFIVPTHEHRVSPRVRQHAA